MGKLMIMMMIEWHVWLFESKVTRNTFTLWIQTSFESYLDMPLMQMAKSLVMAPDSIVCTQTSSRAKENFARASLLSSLARWARPRVQA